MWIFTYFPLSFLHLLDVGKALHFYVILLLIPEKFSSLSSHLRTLFTKYFIMHHNIVIFIKSCLFKGYNLITAMHLLYNATLISHCDHPGATRGRGLRYIQQGKTLIIPLQPEFLLCLLKSFLLFLALWVGSIWNFFQS